MCFLLRCSFYMEIQDMYIFVRVLFPSCSCHTEDRCRLASRVDGRTTHTQHTHTEGHNSSFVYVSMFPLSSSFFSSYVGNFHSFVYFHDVAVSSYLIHPSAFRWILLTDHAQKHLRVVNFNVKYLSQRKLILPVILPTSETAQARKHGNNTPK